ncbi:MAG: hypothetical protein ACRCT1_20360 [Microcoleaceae cyanobacterium]
MLRPYRSRVVGIKKPGFSQRFITMSRLREETRFLTMRDRVYLGLPR